VIYEIVVTGQGGSSRTFQVELETSGGSKSASPSPALNLTGKVDGQPFGNAVSATILENGGLSLLVDGKSYEIRRDQQGEQTEIHVGAEKFVVELRDPRSLRARRGQGAASGGPKKITAPMPGKVIRILAPEGTQVEAGQGVLVIEAMKMQNELKSPKAGVVKRVMAREGATVNPGDALAIVE